MSRDKEHTLGVGKKGLGSRGTNSKCSFPPSYFSTMNGISSNLGKVSLQDEHTNLNNSGFNFNLSAKKKKPRRSMLGRRTKNFSQNPDAPEPSNFMKPLFSSSPKSKMERLCLTPQTDRSKSPPHPFSSNLNSSSFFESGQSNFSTWSIFKKGNMHQPPRTPGIIGKTKVLAQSVPVKNPVKETNKSFKLDDSLGTIPLDCLSPKVENENVNKYSALKNKKLSVVKEETENSPPIISILEPTIQENLNEEEEEPIKNLSELIQRWFVAKKEWDKSRKQLEERTEKMNELNEEINQILKSQITTDELLNTIVSNQIKPPSDKENENPNKTCSSSKNDLVDSIYGEYKSSYSLLQSPSMLSSVKKKPISSLCYTPNSLSSCVKQQIRLIYGNED